MNGRKFSITELKVFFKTMAEIEKRIEEIAPLCTDITSREDITGFSYDEEGDICIRVYSSDCGNDAYWFPIDYLTMDDDRIKKCEKEKAELAKKRRKLEELKEKKEQERKEKKRKEKKRKTSKMDKNMNTYMKKSPIYYAIIIQGFQNEFGWYLSNEDEIDEFAKKFDMDWHWNMRKGVLDFNDKSDGVKLNRPWNVRIGQVVIAYDDWGTWRVDLWDYDRFVKNFIRVESERFAQRSIEHGAKDEHR